MDDGGPSRAAVVAEVTLGAALVGAVAASFAPWLQTGEARRSSYQVVQAAARLDVVSGPAEAVVRVVWALLPLTAALGLLALARRRRRVAAGLALAVGVVEVGLALLVKEAPSMADWGVSAALVVGTIVVVAALAVAQADRSGAWT